MDDDTEQHIAEAVWAEATDDAHAERMRTLRARLLRKTWLEYLRRRGELADNDPD
jgi:hypothetical protein